MSITFLKFFFEEVVAIALCDFDRITESQSSVNNNFQVFFERYTLALEHKIIYQHNPLRSIKNTDFFQLFFIPDHCYSLLV